MKCKPNVAQTNGSMFAPLLFTLFRKSNPLTVTLLRLEEVKVRGHKFKHNTAWILDGKTYTTPYALLLLH